MPKLDFDRDTVNFAGKIYVAVHRFGIEVENVMAREAGTRNAVEVEPSKRAAVLQAIEALPAV